MNRIYTFLPSLVIALVVLGNLLIVWNTESKIPDYGSNPPFRLDDFTKSFRISSRSKLLYTLDHDPHTRWIKLNEGLEEADFDAELSLTHYWNGELFATKSWKTLDVEFCSDQTIRLEVLLREAINVDKELRLPDDEKFVSGTFSPRKNETVSLDISSLTKLPPSNNYPQGISIIVLRGKILEAGLEPACIGSLKLSL